MPATATATGTIRFSDLHTNTRGIFLVLFEAHKAMLRGYSGTNGAVQLAMWPHHDRKGWSAEARALHELLLRLGFQRVDTGWKEMATYQNEMPWADWRGYLFSVEYLPTRDVFGCMFKPEVAVA